LRGRLRVCKEKEPTNEQQLRRLEYIFRITCGTSPPFLLDCGGSSAQGLCSSRYADNVANYRRVILTVNLCKVFESITKDKVIGHLERYKLIKGTQHGFVRNKSCLTNMLVFMEEVTVIILTAATW